MCRLTETAIFSAYGSIPTLVLLAWLASNPISSIGFLIASLITFTLLEILRRSHRDVGALLGIVSPGELVDLITISEIKSQRLPDPRSARLELARREKAFEVFQRRTTQKPPQDTINHLRTYLKEVNLHQWILEDEVRAGHPSKAGEVALHARKNNDRRVRVKNDINALFKWSLEEKHYKELRE